MRIIARVTPRPGDPEIVVAVITKEEQPELLQDAKAFINKNHLFTKDAKEAHVAQTKERTPTGTSKPTSAQAPTIQNSVFIGAHMPACNVVGCCVPQANLS